MLRYIIIVLGILSYNHIKAQDTTNTDSTEIISNIQIYPDSIINQHLMEWKDLPVDSTFLKGYRGSEFLPMEGAPKKTNQNLWVLISFFTILTFIALLRMFDSKWFFIILRSMNIRNDFDDVMRDRPEGFNLYNIFLLIIYSLTLSLGYVWGLLKIEALPFKLDTGLNFILIFLVIALGGVLRILIISLGGKLFETEKLASAHIYNISFLSFIESLILLPLFIIWILNPGVFSMNQILVVSVALIGVMVLYRAFKVLVTSNSEFGYPLIYLILYLCTLEILPGVVILELLVQKILEAA